MLYSSSDLAESGHSLLVVVVLDWPVALRIEAQLFAAYKKLNVRNTVHAGQQRKIYLVRNRNKQNSIDRRPQQISLKGHGKKRGQRVLRTEIRICPLTNAAIDENPGNNKLPFKSALIRREPVRTKNRSVRYYRWCLYKKNGIEPRRQRAHASDRGVRCWVQMES